MFNFKELKKYIIVDETNKNVILNNQKELYLSTEMIKFTEEVIFSNINKASFKTSEEKDINKAFLLLFVQGVKSYKSSLLLCLSGYYTNSIINMRNIIESIFNIMYILESPEDSYQRADKYLNNVSKWTNESVRNRAYLSYNSTLYKLYGQSSDYTHSNCLATSQNYTKDGYLTPYPAEERIDEVLSLTNSVYYYLIEFVCKHYKIDFTKMDDIEKTVETVCQLREFKKFNFSKRYYD